MFSNLFYYSNHFLFVAIYAFIKSMILCKSPTQKCDLSYVDFQQGTKQLQKFIKYK